MTGVALAPATSAGARELAIEREALLPATFFEQLPAALDAEEEAPAELRALAGHLRAFERG